MDITIRLVVIELINDSPINPILNYVDFLKLLN